MRIYLLTALMLVLCLDAYAAGSGSGGGGGFPTSSGSRQLSPEKQAEKNHKSGLSAKEKAWKYEAKAAKASSEKKRNRYLGKAQKQYLKAVEFQAQVLRINPAFYQAANEMGYALRKSGDFKKAIGAYSFALQLKPDYFEAIEYRGEAFLGMGLFKESQEAYMHLFRRSPELAEQLLQAMESWLSDDKHTGQQEFSDWVVERRKLASAVQKLSMTNTQWR